MNFKRGAALGFAAVMLVVSSGCGGGNTDETDAGTFGVTELVTKADDTTQGSVIDFMETEKKTILPESLAASGERAPRWLSLPDSRLVLNPYSFDGAGNATTHAQYSDSVELPLNIGYLDPYSDTGSGR